MKNISGILKIIQDDKEIQNLIKDSKVLNVNHKVPTRKTAKTSKSKAGVMMKYFYESIEFEEVERIFKHRYDINLNSTIVVSRVKDAFIVYFNHYETEG